jgi:hypothetical protein
MSDNILELLQCWKMQGQRQSTKAIWKVVLYLCGAFGERNRRLFEDSESYGLQLKASFLSSLLDWIVTFVPNFSLSNLEDFVNFLDFFTPIE